jgi:hypothetical protein
MLDGATSVRINSKDLEDTKKWCKKNKTRLSIHLQDVIEGLAEKERTGGLNG